MSFEPVFSVFIYLTIALDVKFSPVRINFHHLECLQVYHFAIRRMTEKERERESRERERVERSVFILTYLDVKPFESC